MTTTTPPTRLGSRYNLTRFYTNPLDLQQARALRAIIIGLLIFVSLSSSSVLEQDKTDILYFTNVPIALTIIPYLVIILAFFAGMGFTIFSLYRRVLLSAKILFLATTIFYTVANYVLTEPASVSLITLLIAPVAAGVLLERRGVITTTLIMSGLLTIIVILHQVGVLAIEAEITGTSFDAVIFGIPVMLLLVVLAAAFSGGQRVLLQRNISLANELTGLTEIVKMIGAGISQEDLLTYTVEMTRDQFGFYHVQIFLVEEKSGVVILVSGTGARIEGSSLRRRIIPDDPSIINTVIAEGKTRLITLNDPDMQRTEFLPSTRAELLIPLAYKGQVVGVLDIQSIQSDAFSPRDVEALESIALQVAGVVHTNRLTDAFSQILDERSALVDQLRKMRQDNQQLAQEAGGQAWGIYLENRFGRQVGYEFRDGSIIPSPNVALSLPDLTTPRLVHMDNDPVLLVPITSRGQPLGFMEFRGKDKEAWDERSLDLAKAIAQRVALSLDNLRLFERAQLAVTREQIANQIATILQSKNDVDSLVTAATETFQQALGATRASVRLGVFDTLDEGKG